MTDIPEALKPWYKQPWLWFILAPLFAVIIFATSYAYLSVVTFDGMVKGDYAKSAKSFKAPRRFVWISHYLIPRQQDWQSCKSS
jgi:hypothetical protein